MEPTVARWFVTCDCANGRPGGPEGRDHPWEAKAVNRVLPAIGAQVPDDPNADPAELLATRPMVAFRPAD